MVEKQQVRRIAIRAYPRPVPPLEAHLRALRSVIDESSNSFAQRLGINPVKHVLVENKQSISKDNGAKIIDRLGEDSSLEGNPHAEAVVTLLTLLELKAKE